MSLDSYDHAAWEGCHDRKLHAAGCVVFEAITAKAVGAGDDAQERLAEGAAPRAHGAQVTPAGSGWHAGMGVVEAHDIAPPLFAGQHPRSIRMDTRRFTPVRLQSPAVPDGSAALADERPAHLDCAERGLSA
ncbi:MAG TPA: hypothetical protein VG013_08140 [Gemmataceae bacterium]|nr:hypothetical protein [Gemmataceae bacterium]